ncbi:hypothetical protein EMPS_01619 [Entomortierella parvispora]|uniref:FAD-binding domain-containing protein n=1 Tax=Entomortierella parvispora TaxID=205924 RepID=A0A9P3H390_9FUNG|nr:hypothetical protein EMPS_01619 [Entomortierella parvispora]
MPFQIISQCEDGSSTQSPPETSSSSSSISHRQDPSALDSQYFAKKYDYPVEGHGNINYKNNKSSYVEDEQEETEYDPYAFDDYPDYEERIIGLEDTDWDEDEDDESSSAGDGSGTWLDFLNGIDPKRVDDKDKPTGKKTHHVVIAGGGLGGLMLANLLEKAEISYQILERAPEPQTTGAVMSLCANILPVFEQLGLYEELRNVSFPCHSYRLFRDDMKKIGFYSSKGDKEICGYDRLLFARPELYNILLSKIPGHKIHFSKRVAQVMQDENGITVKCTDKSFFKGDLLVGADGVYSGVRQSLYRQMSEAGILPASDLKAMSKGYICLVGCTDALDPRKYPAVTSTTCYSAIMISDKDPFTWATFTIPGHKICWNIVIQLTDKESEDEQFRNSQWSSELGEKFRAQIDHFKTPFGELGGLIDATPADKISRVFLEDRLYETWNHERVVLIGDAAHKILPSTGQGAVVALLDAVVLANQLYELDGGPHEAIVAALQDYRRQRFKYVKRQHEAATLNAKIQFGHTFLERVLRHTVMTYLPRSLQKRQMLKDATYRPEATFLPPAPKRGTGPVVPQKRSKRYAREQAEALLASEAPYLPQVGAEAV